MVGVLKIDNLSYEAKYNDVRRLFNEHSFRPEDIYFLKDKSGRQIGSGFLVFRELETAKQAVMVSGSQFMGRRISVKQSSPREFDKFFPGIALFSCEQAIRNQRKANATKPSGKINRSNIIENRSRMFESAANTYSKQSTQSEKKDYFAPKDSYRKDERNRRDNRKRSRSRSPFRGHKELKRRSYSGDYGKFREEPGRNTINDFRPKTLNHSHNETNIDIDYKRFVKVNNMPSDVSDVEIQRFFEPLLTREVFYLRHESGRLAGTLNGTIIVEFYSESDAHQATNLDRKRFGGNFVYVGQALKDEVYHIMQGRGDPTSTKILNNIPDIAAVASNPQVQHLINLLSATVTNLTGGEQNMGIPQQFNDNGRQDRNRREVNDPVVSRVANSANINVGDISMGKVIGIRNLPYSVTPGEILQFFQGYHAIADSVRIHYLEDGRCSGDAIISFHNHRDAKDAVSALNKRSIARRKVELFFL